MTPCELAKLYYPRLWPLERLDKLLELGRITQEEYNGIVGEDVSDDHT